jgi:hypothetical protein
MSGDDAGDAEEGFSETETQEEETLLVRGSTIKKPDAPEKQRMFFCDFEAQEEMLK